MAAEKKIKRFDDEDMQEIKDCIAFGIVSSVNAEKMTARVEIADQEIVSADLKILQNTPLITVINTDGGVPWKHQFTYVQHDKREMKLEDDYRKAFPAILQKENYKKEYTGRETFKKEYPDYLETWNDKGQKQEIRVFPWIPYIGQYVLCLFIPGGDGDGFILGGV